MNEKIENKFEKVREIIIDIILAMWIIIPILKNLRITWIETTIYEYPFILIVGSIGLFFFGIDIYIKSKQKKDVKTFVKEFLPIIILLIFMIWTWISCLFSVDLKNSFWGTEYRKDGYFSYLAYSGFFACAFLVKSKKSKKILINMSLIVAILNIIMVELYRKGVMIKILAPRTIDRTVFYNFNHYGYYLVLATVSSVFLFITQKNKIIKPLYLIAYTFLVYNLILNDTFGCYIALAITLILFAVYAIYHKNKKNIVSAIFIILIFIVMSLVMPKARFITQRNMRTLFNDIKNIIAAEQIKNDELKTDEEIKEAERIEMLANNAGTERMKLWKNGVKFFLNRPILGYGPENLEEEYEKVGIKQDRPHNLLIQLATTSGIIGVISYVTAIAIILIRGLKTMKMENSIHIISFFVVIAYLISAMFGNSMYYTSPYFFIFLGILMNENIGTKKKEVQ